MNPTVNRRNFLGQSAAGGALVAASVATTPATRASAAARSTNDQVVVGVMGLSRGRSLATTFGQRENVVVKYVCDVDTQRAEACAAELAKRTAQRPQALSDFRHILDDNEVDALVCAAPNHWHAPATIMACAAGKHVYVEKPCSHNPREGELMVAASRKHKRAVQLGTQRRSGPGTQAAMQDLANGAIGRVYLANAWYANSRLTIGKGQTATVPEHLDYDLWQGPAPRTDYLSNRVHYNWHWFWHWGNGELGNNGVHTLDLCRWGLQVTYPTRVTSAGGRYHYEDDQQTPDTHTVSFEFDNRCAITWKGLSCNRNQSGFVTFHGDDGSLALDSNGGYRILDNKAKERRVVKPTSRGDVEHVANFLTAIRTDKPLELNAEIEKGHQSTLLCHLGNIAHRTGRTLDCDPTNGHILNDPEAMKLWARDYEPGWEPKV